MFRTLPLLHELERRARALGFTWAALAAEVGIDRTTLAHIRSGRGRLSLGTLHRIAVWFPTDAAIQRCVWEYLLHDVETARERTERERLRARGAEAHLDTLAPSTRMWLRGFVIQFSDYAVRGQSALLFAADARLLAAAAGFLEVELTARGMRVLRQPANATPAARLMPALLAAPLLLVERYEFASEATARLVSERSRHGKVTVATVRTIESAAAPLEGIIGDWTAFSLEDGPA